MYKGPGIRGRSESSSVRLDHRVDWIRGERLRIEKEEIWSRKLAINDTGH